MTERYIILSDTIIDREKIVVIERDPELAGRIWVTLINTTPRYFDGADAIQLWRMFDREAGWK